jgi:MoxR-like ATPase
MSTETEIDAFELEQQAVEQLRAGRTRIDQELSKAIVGQADVVEQLLIALFAGGHCLITGAPGLAKTLLVRSVAQVFHLRFQRIQFTPDLMPADITGTEILEQGSDGHRHMQFVPGPIFGNVILADEINRTPPKTQAALLEAMQEHQVTVAGVRYPLEEPFFVLATQNPIEMEGTYPLPEAQLDRFMFNVLIDYLPEDDEVTVVQRTTARRGEAIKPLFTGQDILRFHDVVRKVPVSEETRALRGAIGRCQPTRKKRDAALCDGLGQLGRWNSSRSVLGARRQGASAPVRPPSCDSRRHPRTRSPHPPASHSGGISSRSGRN